jgi:RHS repeat-associated protein
VIRNYPDLKYTGKDLDEDTGLYYYNARWYDAGTGRFISEDPARDGQNWFIYVSNNPLKFIDPTGMREVVYEDERGNLTIENPDGTLKDRNNGDDRTREYTERSGTEKPDDPTKPGNFNTNGLLPEGALTPKEIPEEVAKALLEAGIEIVASELTPEEFQKMYNTQFNSNVFEEGVIINIGVSGAIGAGGISIAEAGIMLGIEPGSTLKFATYDKVGAGLLLGGTTSAGFTGGITFGSGNPSILDGQGNQNGGSIGNGLTAGMDISLDSKNGLVGVSGTAGIGAKIPMAFEAHSIVTDTNVYPKNY